MKIKIYSFLILFTISLLGCIRAENDNSQEEKNKIQELSHQWTNAINAKDLDKILNLYSEDAVQMQSGNQAIVGKIAIRKWYQTWFTEPNLSYTASTIKIEISSSLDLAYERGTYSFNQNTPNGLLKEVGKYLTIWKKINGEWKAIIDTGTPDSTFKL